MASEVNRLKAGKSGGFLPAVFVPAAAMTLLLVLFAIVFPDAAGAVFLGVNGWILNSLGWLWIRLMSLLSYVY